MWLIRKFKSVAARSLADEDMKIIISDDLKDTIFETPFHFLKESLEIKRDISGQFPRLYIRFESTTDFDCFKSGVIEVEGDKQEAYFYYVTKSGKPIFSSEICLDLSKYSTDTIRLQLFFTEKHYQIGS